MTDPHTTGPGARSDQDVAPYVKLPEPGRRRFGLGTILIIIWVLAFLTIFGVLAWRKLNPPARQGPVLPDTQQTAPRQDPSGAVLPEGDAAP